MPDRSDAEQFEQLYVRLWGALHRPDDPDLTQHERDLLHHVPATGGIDLTGLARHLALPKLQLVLTEEGRRRVETDRVLEPARLAEAMSRLTPDERAALLATLSRLADEADHP